MKVIEDGGDQVYTNYAIDIGSDGQYELQGKALIFCVSGQIFSDTQIQKI